MTTERPGLHVVPAPPQRVDDRANFKRLCLESIPQRDIDRLKAQMTPRLRRSPIFPGDRDEMSRLLSEWQLRGLPVYAFNAVHDLLWEEHRAERQAASAPLRRYWDQFLTSLYGPDQAGSEPSADARHRALELGHGRRRVPFPADVP